MKNFLTVFGIVIILFSCKKDDTGLISTLPGKTQTGQNTLGFMLNNSVWTNYGSSCLLFTLNCQKNVVASFLSGNLSIYSDRTLYKNGSWNTIEEIHIYLETRFRGPTLYSIMANDEISVGYYFSEKRKPLKFYVPALTNPNFSLLITKIDTVQKIVSGEFNGTLFSKAQDSTNAISTTDSIIIKDGRFDIKL